MKRFFCLILSICVIFGVITVAYAKTGDVLGYAKYTDISAYINHYPITSYNINDYTAVIAEDLRNYGFNVVWNGEARSLSITKNSDATQITPYGTVYKYSAKAGENSFPYLQTDIVTYVNGNKVDSFNIDGKTCVYIDALATYGEVVWVPEIRAIKLWLEGLPIKAYTPIDEAPTNTMYTIEGSAIAFVNNTEITDLDIKYYIYEQVIDYAMKNNLSDADIKNYDWEREVAGKKLSDVIKQNAIVDAITDTIVIKKGEENYITLSNEEKSQIDNEMIEITSRFGEDGFNLRARTMGIANAKQYKRMYEKVMVIEKVEIDIEENPYKYYPVDVNVLNDYIQPDGATVKHILVSQPDLAWKVLERAKKGEDFDALVEAFGEDPGATKSGYTFGSGMMVPEFEAASFALKIGEISGVVESDYGYHIIKRIPGIYELKAYWLKTFDDVEVNEIKFANISVKDIVKDVFIAMNELDG